MLIGVLQVTNLHAQEPMITADSLSYNIKSGWKYTTRDSAAFSSPDYIDSTWKAGKTTLTDYDTTQKDFEGIAWFRFTFATDSSIAHKQLAMLLNHTGASEIYLDGALLKKFGVIASRDSSQYYDPNNIPFILPPLNEGRHVLAIRYANYDAKFNARWLETHDAGFSDVVFVRADEHIKALIDQTAALTFISIILVGIFSVLAFLHFSLWMFYRQDYSNFYFSIFAVCFALFFCCGFFAFITTNVKLGLYTTVVIEPLLELVFVALCLVVREIFAKKEKIFVSILMVLFIGSLIIQFAYPRVAATLTFFVIFGVSLYCIVFIFIGVRKRIPGAKILGTGIAFTALFLFGLLGASLMLDNVQINNSTPLGVFLVVMSILSILSIPISMSLYLSWNYSRVNRDLRGQLEQVKLLSEKTIQQEQDKLKLISSQNEMLEQKVEERTFQLQTEKKKSDTLLLNILPEEVAEELKNTGSAEAKQYNNVSVLFTDFVNFTGLSEQMTPKELVQEIHRNFTAFDAIIEKHGLEKIKTIGDAYMAVCGLPIEMPDHAQRVIKAAFEIRAYMEQSEGTFKIRMGIHSGAVVAGIVGVKKYAYDIWGDTVNTAARMEQNSESGKINISGATYELVKDQFDCVHRGKVQAKNKGEIDMYFVE